MLQFNGTLHSNYVITAVWMIRCKLLIQKLAGHISEVSDQNKLNFDLVQFLYGPNVCANF